MIFEFSVNILGRKRGIIWLERNLLTQSYANLTDTKTLPISKWKQEYADLKEQRDTDYTKLKATRAEVAELQKIRKCVDIALKAEQPEQTQNRTKRHDIDR